MNRDNRETTRRAVVAGLAAAPVAGLPAVAGAISGDDATLLELGKRLEAAWANEIAAYSLWRDDDEDDSAKEHATEATTCTGEIADAILAVKATTLDGLKIKARALSWCNSGNFYGFAEPWTTATEVLIADSILFDLIALDAIDREARS